MREFHGRATARTAATPEAIFGLITDLDRLTEWNGAIEALVRRPADLVPGAEWMVTMHPPRLPRWGSISRVGEIDTQKRRFAYETRNADGNPSYTRWAWEVEAAGTGTMITVTWDCYLRTADRRFLAGPLRKRQLAREVPRSLSAIDSAVRRRAASAG
jgi:uncharacterized protein YndB with AHSA1/START domain